MDRKELKMAEHEHKLQLTVLVDGIPKKEEYPPHMKVEEGYKISPFRWREKRLGEVYP